MDVEVGDDMAEDAAEIEFAEGDAFPEGADIISPGVAFTLSAASPLAIPPATCWASVACRAGPWQSG